MLIEAGAAKGLERSNIYLLRHDAGVVLFGTKADLSAHYADLRALGRITHVLLGDRHRAVGTTL